MSDSHWLRKEKKLFLEHLLYYFETEHCKSISVCVVENPLTSVK